MPKIGFSTMELTSIIDSINQNGADADLKFELGEHIIMYAEEPNEKTPELVRNAVRLITEAANQGHKKAAEHLKAFKEQGGDLAKMTKEVARELEKENCSSEVGSPKASKVAVSKERGTSIKI